MDEFFNLFEKRLEKLFLALVGITRVKGTSVIEKDAQRGGAAPLKSWTHFGTISYQKVDKKTMQKPMSKKHENNCKRLPK